MSAETPLSHTDMSQISTYQSGVAQSSAHRVLNRVISDFLADYDLTTMQWYVIGLVFDTRATGITLGDLATKLGTTLPYITNTIADLEKKGIVSKRPHEKDSRIKLATINSDHYEMVCEIEENLRDELRRVLYNNDHISREDLSAYIRVLYKIIGE